MSIKLVNNSFAKNINKETVSCTPQMAKKIFKAANYLSYALVPIGAVGLVFALIALQYTPLSQTVQDLTFLAGATFCIGVLLRMVSGILEISTYEYFEEVQKKNSQGMQQEVNQEVNTE
ncbi:MAG: hypothetical protein JJU12_03150 [Chlamydiales bacterium]|nr:hypothetical protein [Chlamydiales bacterium]